MQELSFFSTLIPQGTLCLGPGNKEAPLPLWPFGPCNLGHDPVMLLRESLQPFHCAFDSK